MTTTNRTDAHQSTAVDEPPAATGVARGSLGTGANLDDTQVYEVDDLTPPAGAGSLRAGTPAASAVSPRALPPPLTPVAPAAPALRPASTRGRTGAPGGVIAAIVLAAVFGGAALLAIGQGGASSGVPPGLGSSTVAPTIVPVTGQPATGGNGGNHGGGHGHGRGNGR